jgi:hypothetical protein
MMLRPFIGLSLPALLVATASCGHLPGGHGLPGSSGEVDPNTCGNYAAQDAGAKLKAFLQATKDLDTTTQETAKVIKQSCLTFGNKLGMDQGQLGGDDTDKICTNVFNAYKADLQVGLKAGAKLTIAYTPAQCTADASASASASAGCSGDASAGNGGASAQGQCAAAAKVEASVHVNCTPPSLNITASAGVVADKSKLDLAIGAAMAALPDILSVSARIQPIKDAFDVWASAAKDLAAMGPKFAQSFADQAMCISGQVAAAASASAHIQANVSVSVNVSASASGSVAGG